MDLDKDWSLTTISRLSQQSVVNWTLGNGPVSHQQPRGVFLELSFQRQIGFYVLQVYIPLCIIVYASFLSFWIVKTENGKEITARTYLLGKNRNNKIRKSNIHDLGSCSLAVILTGSDSSELYLTLYLNYSPLFSFYLHLSIRKEHKVMTRLFQIFKMFNINILNFGLLAWQNWNSLVRGCSQITSFQNWPIWFFK